MSDSKQQVRPDIYPVLRYKNGSKAMEWLTQVFGFSKHMEVPGPDGEVAHAELSFGNGMIMLGSGGKPGRAIRGRRSEAASMWRWMISTPIMSGPRRPAPKS